MVAIPIGPILMGGSLLAKMFGGSKAKNREAQNTAAASADQLKQQAYQTRQNAMIQALLGQSREQLDQGDLDLRQRQFALQAPSIRGKQGLLGSMIQGYRPATSSGNPRVAAHMPQISGGLSLGPQAGLIGKLLTAQAIKGLQSGDRFQPMQRTNFQGGVMTTPQPTPYKKPGLMEKLLGLGGAAGELYGGYKAGAFGRPTPPYNSSDSGGY